MALTGAEFVLLAALMAQTDHFFTVFWSALLTLAAAGVLMGTDSRDRYCLPIGQLYFVVRAIMYLTLDYDHDTVAVIGAVLYGGKALFIPVYLKCSSSELPSLAESVSPAFPSVRPVVSIAQCPICLEDNSDVAIPCGHLFHRSCLLCWLAENRTCPVCRLILNSRSDDDENRSDDDENEN